MELPGLQRRQSFRRTDKAPPRDASGGRRPSEFGCLGYKKSRRPGRRGGVGRAKEGWERGGRSPRELRLTAVV